MIIGNEYKAINGISYIRNYISETEENSLVSKIDSKSWLCDLKRRVQHYGYKYDYKAKKLSPDFKIENIPYELNILPNFDQAIVNEYMPGQGISPHIDCITCFDNIICVISLLSPCKMIFEQSNQKIPLILEPRSLLTIKDDARYYWKHSIPANKSNISNRRLSITFRKVLL